MNAHRPQRPDCRRDRWRAGHRFCHRPAPDRLGRPRQPLGHERRGTGLAVDALGAASSSKIVDITDLAGLQRTHDEVEVEAELGPVSILVNSAGIAGPNATLEDFDPEEWRKSSVATAPAITSCCSPIRSRPLPRYGNLALACNALASISNPVPVLLTCNSANSAKASQFFIQRFRCTA